MKLMAIQPHRQLTNIEINKMKEIQARVPAVSGCKGLCYDSCTRVPVHPVEAYYLMVPPYAWAGRPAVPVPERREPLLDLRGPATDLSCIRAPGSYLDVHSRMRGGAAHVAGAVHAVDAGYA
jgi:hypothetical protein